MVTLSVIVAMCDVRDYCRTALKSLALNAREDFEFIVVDDGSVDGTSEILREMVPRIPGAVLIRNPYNQGISATRNIGLSAARGRFFTFLDGDDWYAPGYLAQLVGWMSESGVDFLRTGHVRVYGRKRKIVMAPLAPRALPLNPVDYIGPVDASTFMDYPQSWAASTTASASWKPTRCSSTRACAPPRTARGSTSCTCGPAPSESSTSTASSTAVMCPLHSPRCRTNGSSTSFPPSG